MFSGIVETKTELLEYTTCRQSTQVKLKKPIEFNDIAIKDSICVNGVCLTVEALDEVALQFSLGAETLKVTGWDEKYFRQHSLNLERSLRLNDRIHGHLVSGHVDGMAVVREMTNLGGSWLLKVEVPKEFSALIWQKGSVTLNGVSLTINEVFDSQLSVCLIPETVRRTNLGELQVGDTVTLEVDQFARGLARFFAIEKEHREQNL